MTKKRMHAMCSIKCRTENKIHCVLKAIAFIAFLAAIGGSGSATAAGTNADDATAMNAIAKSLKNLPTSWTTGGDPCKWEGVTCDVTGRVAGINLVSAGVSGTLVADLGSLTGLTSLQLQRNNIGGAFPVISKLAALQSLFLDGNAFTFVPDGFFSGLAALQKVSLDDVPFASWNFTDDLASATSLSLFSASNASIIGKIPDFFGTLTNLQILRLSYNSLTGGIPESFGGSGIQQLLLNNQQSQGKLTGRIDVIGQMPQLTMLWLQSNAFTGPIPDVSNLTGLESFNVRDNALTGPVPQSLIDSGTLKNVSLSNNYLQGPFPLFAKPVITDVDKGNNFCSSSPGQQCDDRVMVMLAVAEGFGYPLQLATSWKGNSPCGANWVGVTCDSQGKDVVVLNFANQLFGGVISPAMSNITSLTKIILSNNYLTGSIPDSLTQLGQLQLLDVTDNNLSGIVPIFPPSVTLKLTGNPMLGKEPDSGGGNSPGGASNSSTSGSSSDGSKKTPVALVIGIIIVVLVLIGCLVAVFLYYRRKKQEKRFGQVQTQSPPGEREVFKIGMMGLNANANINVSANSSSTGGPNTLFMESNMGSNNAAYLGVSESQGLQMSTQSLLIATDNFSDDNIVGRGGFGVVYKGNLNGTLVAVKRNEYAVMGKKGQEEYKAEIDVLRKVRHRNLVALLGYSDDGKERLLVYEYMAGGTLGQHLFEWQTRNDLPLTWKQRLTIALDVARGIEYLHSLAQESFIHRDLKPSNILLDKDLRAKVSDFGLVKLAEDKQKSMMTRLAGTFGYVAPEYATTGRASSKVDVYAFGVILMEIITGRKVLDESLPAEDCNLVPLFRRKYSHEKLRFFEFVDRVLDLDEEAQQSLMEVADLAWHCTAREHYQRPDMSHAVNRLAPLVDQWKPSAFHHDDDDDGDSSLGLAQRLERWRHDDSSSTQLFSGYK